MWAVARRPRWIALLVLALAVAAGFAALGQWQLDRSVTSGEVLERDTETVKPLDEVAEPQTGMTERLDGQRVEVAGELVPGDFRLVSGRLNAGAEGYWVLGHLETDARGADDASVVVALGWTADRSEAQDALERADAAAGPADVVGRYVAPEAPQLSDFEEGEVTQVSPSALVNEWADFDGRVYAGYVVAAEPAEGLEAIDAPPATSEIVVNWLNVFYAIEWAVFAGFAVFLWYRLVRDAWEREEEERAEAAAGGADVGGTPSTPR